MRRVIECTCTDETRPESEGCPLHGERRSDLGKREVFRKWAKKSGSAMMRNGTVSYVGRRLSSSGQLTKSADQ